MNAQQQAELWKGLRILFWGGLGVITVIVLRWLGVDLDPITTAIVTVGANAILFTGKRYIDNR